MKNTKQVQGKLDNGFNSKSTPSKDHVFEIPDVHPSLNVWTRMHFHVRNRLKQDWYDMVYLCAKKYKIPFITAPVEIHIEVHHPRSTIDLDNFTCKFILDPLRKNFIHDDNVKCIHKLSYTAIKSKEKKTVVYIKELD